MEKKQELLTAQSIPVSPQTELSVVSLMLKHTDNITLCSDLTKEDFYHNDSSAIYEAVTFLAKQSFTKVDIATVHDTLLALNYRALNMQKLQAIKDMVVHSDNITEFKRTLKEKAGERRLIQSADKIRDTAYKLDLSFDEKVAAASGFLTNMQVSLEDRTITYADAKVEALVYIKNRKANPNAALKWGFKQLDEATGGITEDLIIIGGMTGGGKTAFVTCVAENLSYAGHKGLFFSAEMNSVDVIFREIQRGTGIPVTRMKLGDISEQEEKEIENFVPPENIYINDISNLDVDRLCSIAKIQSRKFNLKYVMVDYLQLLTTTKHHNNPVEQVKYIANQLKALSKDLKIPVIALAQYNKEAGTSIDRKPAIRDLRDSSQIAMNAGVILFVHRQDYFDEEARINKHHPYYGLAELIVEKSRNGMQVTTFAKWEATRARFTDVVEGFRPPVENKPTKTGGFKKASSPSKPYKAEGDDEKDCPW